MGTLGDFYNIQKNIYLYCVEAVRVSNYLPWTFFLSVSRLRISGQPEWKKGRPQRLKKLSFCAAFFPGSRMFPQQMKDDFHIHDPFLSSFRGDEKALCSRHKTMDKEKKKAKLKGRFHAKHKVFSANNLSVSVIHLKATTQLCCQVRIKFA